MLKQLPIYLTAIIKMSGALSYYGNKFQSTLRETLKNYHFSFSALAR